MSEKRADDIIYCFKCGNPMVIPIDVSRYGIWRWTVECDECGWNGELVIDIKRMNVDFVSTKLKYLEEKLK